MVTTGAGCRLLRCGGCRQGVRIVAQRYDGFQGHVAALYGPFVGLFHQDGADQAENGLLVWKYVVGIFPTRYLSVKTFDWVC